jgi:hypothetical protein
MARGRRNIWVLWVWANGCGLLLGVLLHIMLVHGSTPAASKPGTLLFEKLGLSVAAFVLCVLQQLLVRVFICTTWRDVLFQTGLTLSAFWIGFYATQIPSSHVIAILLLGIAAGWFLPDRPGEWRRWMWLSTAGFVGAALLELLATSPSHSAIGGAAWLLKHVIAWNYFGLFSGVASASMTGWQLAQTLRHHQTATESSSRAMASAHSLQLLLNRR